MPLSPPHSQQYLTSVAGPPRQFVNAPDWNATLKLS